MDSLHFCFHTKMAKNKAKMNGEQELNSFCAVFFGKRLAFLQDLKYNMSCWMKGSQRRPAHERSGVS
jgi:hypothetical protein